MKFLKTIIPEVILVKPTVYEDHRGYFMESYHMKKFILGGIKCEFVQDNHAKSIKNTLRGLHYQANFPQAKLLRCTKGKVLDVAVDIRIDSPTFGHWVSEELSEDNKHQLFIPSGFAHGYYVISEIAEINYKCSELYYPEFDRGIRWNDKQINIDWLTQDPILSKKDSNLPFFKDIFNKNINE